MVNVTKNSNTVNITDKLLLCRPVGMWLCYVSFWDGGNINNMSMWISDARVYLHLEWESEIWSYEVTQEAYGYA